MAPALKSKKPVKPVCTQCGESKSITSFPKGDVSTCLACLRKAPEPTVDEPCLAVEEPEFPVAEIDYSSPTAQEIAARTLARRNLLHFIKRFRPGYDAGWMHHDICRRLVRFMEDVQNKKSPRLLLMCPPRSGKSEISSRHFAPWILGHNPEWEVIAASHTGSLAMSFSRYIRDVMRDPSYQALFPSAKLDPSSQSVENWNTTRGGGYLAVGQGGGITGRGSHCFPADTLVRTLTNSVRIDHLVPRQKVLSYDHAANKLCLREVEAVKITTRSDIYEVVTRSGRSFRATSDHPVFVRGKGYTQASLLRGGDTLIVATLPDLRGRKVHSGKDVSRVLLRGEKGASRTGMHALHEEVSAFGVRVREVTASWAQRLLLLIGMQPSGPRCEEHEALCELRRPYTIEREEQRGRVLFERMRRGDASEAEGESLPSVRHSVLAKARVAASSLFSGLRKRGSLEAHGRRSELTPHEWCRSGSVGGEIAPVDTGSGLRAVCGVRGCGKSARASCESHSHSQYAGEPNNAVCELPHHASQVEEDAVAVVRELCEGSIEVYDLQVEGANNFFAEEVLVHNCLILDDLVKDIESADSQLQRDNTWSWYISTAYTRLSPGGGVLAVMTTWHMDDFAGRIQQMMDAGEGDVFEIVKYPAINDQGDEYILSDDTIAQFPPGSQVPEGAKLTRLKDTAVHPARYDTEAMLRIKRNFYASGQKRMWASLYQQNPVPEDGAYFTRQMFRYFASTPHPSERVVYQAWDWAISEKAQSDYTVGVTIAQDHNDNLYVLDVYRFKMGDGQELMQRVVDYAIEWQPTLIGFEDGQIFKSLQSTFTKTCNERSYYPSYEVLSTLTDKMVRAQPLRGRMQVGKVWLPATATWLDEFKTEFLRFPAGKHDDQVDATAHCIRLMMSKIAPKLPDPKRLPSWKDRLGSILKGQKGGHMAA